MNNPSETPWDRVAASRREAVAAMPLTDEVSPLGFTTRVVALWAERRQNETLCLWGRWSLRAAIGGLLAAGVMAFFSHPQTTGGTLKVPEIEIPAFSAR
jgi:hypothetical protein